jgi:Fe-S cluster biogenesis protein NfuA
MPLTKSQAEELYHIITIFEAALGRDQLAKIQEQLKKQAQKRMEAKARKNFKKLETEIIKTKDLTPNNLNDKINWDGFSLSLELDFKRELGSLAQEVAATIDSNLKNVVGVNWELEVNPAIQNWLETHTAELVREITDSTQAAIRAVVNENYQNWIGTTTRTMAKDLRPIVGLTEYQKRIVDNYREKLETQKDMGIYRSQKQIDSMVANKAERIKRARCKLIAEQESNLAARQGSLTVYGANSSIISVQWFANNGACESCASMDGKIMSTQEFDSIISGIHNGTSINCNCVPLPVTDETVQDPDYWAARQEKFQADLLKAKESGICTCGHFHLELI